jgi:predicted dehydrogenase
VSATRAAIVGAGLMGRWHADAVRRVGGRVVAVVDLDPQRAAALSRGIGPMVRAVGDLRELLSQEGVDVVHICTPVSSHESLASLAIEAGAHVLMEKPLTPDSGMTEQLYSLAQRHAVLLCPVHQFLFQDGVLEAQETLPTLGVVRHIELVACSAGAAGQGADTREAIALDILPHGIALAGRLLNQELARCEWIVNAGPPGEIRAMADVGEASVMLAVSMASRPTENSLTVRCDGGTIRADLFHGFARIERGAASRLDKLARPFASSAGLFTEAAVNLAKRAVLREPAYPGLRELVRRFYLATEDLGESPISVREAIDVGRVRDRIAEARAARAR